MTGYVITTEIDGGACLSRSVCSVACVSQNKLPKLSQCVQVFEWRNSLPRLALLRWPVEWICSRRRSCCQRSRLPRTKQKKKIGGWNVFFCSGAVSSLGSFPGPQAACSHDHLFPGCLQGRCLYALKSGQGPPGRGTFSPLRRREGLHPLPP